MADVLIIDDDEKICKMLSRILKSSGHNFETAFTLHDGEEKAFSRSFDMVFLDVFLPDGNGLEALPRLRKTPSSPEVIIMTGEGNADGAELAIKGDAWDYIQKPFSQKEVKLHLIRALQFHERKKSPKPPLVLRRESIIGNSPQIGHCLDLLAQASTSNASVLIYGETGTGKELFARAIHHNSPRCNNGFVVVDCAALPETLVESTLFGHKKGAFTGAETSQDGLIKQADGGTLFLDEIGELPLVVQKTFLRVLQEHLFRRVGGKKELKSDFRLVAATNRDLHKMVQNGQFRNDILFRLEAFSIELPPLRHRVEDIKELTIHYLKLICAKHTSGSKDFSPDFLQALVAYDWPGNVRELANTLERVIAATPNESILFAKHLPPSIRIKLARASVSAELSEASKKSKKPDQVSTFKKYKEDGVAMLERRYLEALISQTNGNIQEACRISELSQSRLYGLLKKHKVSKPA